MGDAEAPNKTDAAGSDSPAWKKYGSAGLAIALYLILADAAVETLLSGSPLRWWLSAAVGLYFALSVLLWSRIEWSSRARVSLVVFLVLLTFSVWRPEGLEHGVVLLAQPTSVVLSLVTAAVIVFSVVVLLRQDFLPSQAKWGIGAIGIYGLVALLLGAMSETSYTDLLRGKSFWSPLPRWFQGALVGSFAIILGALAGSMIEFIRNTRSRDLRAWSTRTLSLFLSFLILLLGSFAPSGVSTQEVADAQPSSNAAEAAPTSNPSLASSASGTGVALSSAETANRILAVSKFYNSIDQLAAAIPPESISTEALAAALNRDPAKIIEFVKKTIRYQYYEGVMRGAFGTLIGRAGNSWDQCLLLQELLKESNIQSQLIVGRVGDDLDSRLIQRALADRLVIKALPPPLASLMPTVDSQYDFLMSAVPGLAAAFKHAPNRPQVVKTHCWLKATIDGRAQDIDPILGTPPAVSDMRSLSQVTDEDRYRIDLQIVLKKRAQGRIVRTTLLDFAFATDSLRAKPALLALQPADPNFVQKAASTTDPLQVLNGIESFLPVVTLNDQTRSGTAFDLSGNTVAAGAGPLQGMSSLGNGLGGMLGGGRIGSLGASRAQPTPQKNNFAGVDLTYSITPPNVPSIHFSRSLVDASAIQRDAPKWKSVLAVLQDRQILISTFAISPEYLAHLLVEFYRQQRDALEALAQGTQASFPLDKISRSPFQLIGLSLAQDLAAAALSNQQNILLRGEPGVLVFKDTYAVRDEQIIHRQGIDIVDAGFNSVPPDPTSKVLRAKMGISSSVLETLALGVHDPQSVFSLAKLAQQQSIPTLALTSPVDPELAKMTVSAAQRDAIVKELQSGSDIVTFAKPITVMSGPRFGWWRIDPDTGEVLAIMSTGEGEAGTESSLLRGTINGAIVGAVVSGAVAGLVCKADNPQKDCTGPVVCGGLFGGFLGGVGGFAGAAMAGSAGLESYGGSRVLIWLATGTRAEIFTKLLLDGVPAAAGALCGAERNQLGG